MGFASVDDLSHEFRRHQQDPLTRSKAGAHWNASRQYTAGLQPQKTLHANEFTHLNVRTGAGAATRVKPKSCVDPRRSEAMTQSEFVLRTNRHV